MADKNKDSSKSVAVVVLIAAEVVVDLYVKFGFSHSVVSPDYTVAVFVGVLLKLLIKLLP